MIFPPNKTICLGKKIVGRNIKEIKIIPVKKKTENKKFLIISFKN